MNMSAAASISSIATLRLPTCCFPASKSLSLPIIMASFSSSATSSPASTSNAAAPFEANKPPPKLPWLIVGLGNPGKMYTRTRHNVGFEMVDAIAEAEGIALSSVSFKALIGKDQVLVIFDDLDLPFAKLRMLPKGGHGGQNGMRSIIDHFKGNREFPRLRIGIGRPPGKMNPSSYVLRPFTKQELQELDFTFQQGTDALRILLLEGFNKEATFVNTAKPLEHCG